MKEQIILSFKEIENPTFTNKYDLATWKSKAINIVVRVYGENSMK